jgi:hypothetical protein
MLLDDALLYEIRRNMSSQKKGCALLSPAAGQLVWGKGRFEFRRHRPKATAAHMASIKPKGHAPCRKP